MLNDKKLFCDKLKENIKLLIESNNLKEAKSILKNYKQAIKQIDFEVYSMEAIINIKEGDYKLAKKVIKEGLQEKLDDSELLYNLGFIYENLNNIHEAKTLYKLAYVCSKDGEFRNLINNIIYNVTNMKFNDFYNVILVGENVKCLEFKRIFEEWNIVKIIDSKNFNLEKYKNYFYENNYDFIFILDDVDKEYFLNNLKKYVSNDKIYFWKDFNLPVIEGVDYKMARLLNVDKIEGIITGLSYMEVGIREEELKYNFYNLALSAQDLYYDFEVFKYVYSFEEVYKHLKYAIIGISYYSFDYDMTKTIAKYRIHRYLTYIDKHHHNNDLIGLDITRAVYDKIFTFDDYINLSENKETKKIDVDDINGKYESKKNSIMNYNDTRKEYEEILEKYISFLQLHNITPIIVVAPVSKYYYQYFNNGYQKNKFYNVINKLKKIYKFQVIDCFKNESFDFEDFADYGHLNLRGAKKFTKILNKKIKWS